MLFSMELLQESSPNINPLKPDANRKQDINREQDAPTPVQEGLISKRGAISGWNPTQG